MTDKAYKFYKIFSKTPFMLAENIFVKGDINEKFCTIVVHNYSMHEAIDWMQDGVFVKNTSKPFSNKVFIKTVETKFEGNIARLKVHAIDLEYLLIDSFGNDLLKLPKTERVWLNKSDKWKHYYLMSLYAQFGFAKPQTNEILIEGAKIFSAFDFGCEVGFSINNQWGFIANRAWDIYSFLETINDDVVFVWHDYALSQQRLEIDAGYGQTVLDAIEDSILERHKIIYC